MGDYQESTTLNSNSTNREAPASLETIYDLLRHDSISETSNLRLIEYLEAAFARFDIPTHRTYSDDGERANLFATIPAADGSTSGGVVLSGHTDVVPVEGQPWDTDPFEPAIRDGKLYARGAADMKSFIGVALWMLPRFVEADLREPIHYAFTYDEELGCLGAPRMIEEFTSRGIRPRYAIVGEPTLMNIVVAHKAPQRGRLTFRGVPKHSSLAPQGINAVRYAGEFIHFFNQLTDDLRENGPHVEGFNIPYTTGGVNLARGGSAYNIVADRCVLEYDFRIVPETSPEELAETIRDYLRNEIEPKLRSDVERVRGLGGADEKALSQVGVDFEILAKVPALQTDLQDPIVAFAQELGAVLDGGGESTHVSYGTEGGQYFSAGIPAIVCGPGSIAQAHTENEWVELTQINACEKFMATLLEKTAVDH
ncbi:acetylornithine deacetylase [uncultured Kocuria sp.]|uniref:acetylornithine deacetylase n=1 Tax=uncultured Kocuria sp. TaxID=259305 RepID=UPI00259A2A4F|nr:acetylornithine deacetylase [uncultured Kocuria sp.]MCT1367028.1 acetylornithine deacetylase [Rothia sp. p3-SID1597]